VCTLIPEPPRSDLGIKFDTGPRLIPNTQIKSAYLTDPWGTRIELTQNLAPASKK